MPIFQMVMSFLDQDSGLSWKIKNVRDELNENVVKTKIAAWVDIYMGACGSTVQVVDARISVVGVSLDMDVMQLSEFNLKVGQIAGVPTEISSYAQFRGQGAGPVRGSSAWKLHGISEQLVVGSKLLVGNPAILSLGINSDMFFQTFRRVGTGAPNNLPATPLPVPFGSYEMSGMYNRRLGRSFLSPGQQRRMVRA